MQIEFFLRKKHINSIRTKINISLYKQQGGRTQELIQGRGGGKINLFPGEGFYAFANN